MYWPTYWCILKLQRKRISCQPSKRSRIFFNFSWSSAIARTRTCLGDRAFDVAGPRLWNNLPALLRSTDSFVQFRSFQASPTNIFTYLLIAEKLLHCHKTLLPLEKTILYGNRCGSGNNKRKEIRGNVWREESLRFGARSPFKLTCSAVPGRRTDTIGDLYVYFRVKDYRRHTGWTVVTACLYLCSAVRLM